MKFRPLGQTGLSTSILSYGASPLGSVFRDIDETEGVSCVHRALDLGINFIDCSPFYGLTRAETVLGRALQGIARERYLLATKVGRYGEDEFDFSAARVTRSVEESLGRLGVEYVDLIQCHDIEFGDLNQIIDQTLPALRRVVASGKARFVGITGLPLTVFERVTASAEVDTILSYCRYSLNDTSLENLLPTLHSRGVGVISASPLSMGLLTQRGAPDWHPAPDAVKRKCAQAAQFCAERGADISKLALQFALQNEAIATTLVGTASVQNLEKNVRWAEEPLDEDLLREVLAILQPIQNQTWPSGRSENNEPQMNADGRR